MNYFFSKKLSKDADHRLIEMGNLGYKPLVMLQQIHSDHVQCITSPEQFSGKVHDANQLESGDALITNLPNVYIGVKTADCVPILMHDPINNVVAAVHAGWRGTASKIVCKTVEKMSKQYGTVPIDIVAYIGACVCQNCYETGFEVPAALGEQASPFINYKGDKAHVNLREINALWLQNSGVKNITISQDCTACDADTYWSHRIHGSDRGLQYSVIAIT